MWVARVNMHHPTLGVEHTRPGEDLSRARTSSGASAFLGRAPEKVTCTGGVAAGYLARAAASVGYALVRPSSLSTIYAYTGMSARGGRL